MAFQSTVNFRQSWGVVGELMFDGPVRCQPAVLDTTDPDTTPNYIGYAYTFTEEGKVEVGGTGAFAGILVNPKVYANSGTAAGGTLAASMELPNNVIAEFLNMGSILVDLSDGAASIGDQVVYNTTTGALAAVAPGDYLPSGYAPAYGVVSRYDAGSNGLAVVDFTYSLAQPVSP